MNVKKVGYKKVWGNKMKIKDVERWRDWLNEIYDVLEMESNPANDDVADAMNKLSDLIDEMYNLEQKLKKQNNRRAETVKRWQEAIDSYIQAKKDVKNLTVEEQE